MLGFIRKPYENWFNKQHHGFARSQRKLLALETLRRPPMSAKQHLNRYISPPQHHLIFRKVAHDERHFRRAPSPIRKHLLVSLVGELEAAVDKDIRVLFAQLQDLAVRVVDGLRVAGLGGGIDVLVVVVDAHPGGGAACEAGLGGCVPLHGGSGVVAGFLLVFCFDEFLGFFVCAVFV